MGENRDSLTANDVYSWVFKPADDKDKDIETDFQLKAKPDSPFDVSSTQKDFLKVVKGVCAKLKLANPKYRRIDTNNRAIRQKLLRYEGADEFLTLLGFKQSTDAHKFWICDMDQPPLSVLESAINICNDCLLKCNHKRATIDMIKKFSKHDLKSS